MRGRDLALIAGLTGFGAWLALRTCRQVSAFDFSNRVVLITGGSRGLGLVLARMLLREGARVAICARDDDDLQSAEQELKQYGADVLAVRCDVTDQAQVNGMIADIQNRMGAIDVVINNAGIITVGPVETMTLADFEQAMKVNFWGALYTTWAVLPQMRERGQGRIVNISSIGGKISVPHLLPYSASKFALTGLSEGLRAELSKDGIVVTTVCPGLMRTGSPPNALFKGQNEAEYAWFSISDALPGLSMAAERAAGQIINACRRGDAEVVLSLPAQCAVLIHDMFPGLTADVAGLVNRLLPAAPSDPTAPVPGHESESAWSPSVLTTLSDQAAVRNNQT